MIEWIKLGLLFTYYQFIEVPIWLFRFAKYKREYKIQKYGRKMVKLDDIEADQLMLEYVVQLSGDL